MIKKTIRHLRFVIATLAALAPITASAIQLDNPLGTDLSLLDIVARLIKAALGLTGVIALVMVVYGGFLYMTAAGNPEGVKKGTATLKWAALGLLIIVVSASIVDFVFQQLLNL